MLFYWSSISFSCIINALLNQIEIENMFKNYVILHENNDYLKAKKIKQMKIMIDEKRWIGLYIPINIIILTAWMAINIILMLDELQRNLNMNDFFQAILLAYAFIILFNINNFFTARSMCKDLIKKISTNQAKIDRYEQNDLKDLYQNIKSQDLRRKDLTKTEADCLEKAFRIYLSKIKLSNVEIRHLLFAVDTLDRQLEKNN